MSNLVVVCFFLSLQQSLKQVLLRMKEKVGSYNPHRSNTAMHLAALHNPLPNSASPYPSCKKFRITKISWHRNQAHQE